MSLSDDLRRNIDVTEFRVVYVSWQVDPRVTHIFLVEGVPLEDVGVVCVEKTSTKLRQLVEEGKVRFVVSDMTKVKHPAHCILWNEIPLSRYVNALFVQPIYLIELVEES